MTPPARAAGGGVPPSGGGSGTGPRLIPDDAGLLPGMVLGKYQIVRRLGSGGMGSVYEAIHREISKPVALKTLSARLASEPAAQERFLREAISASRLTHPHVVDVTDSGSDNGITFLVMELLRGEDMAAALLREPKGMAVDRLTDIMLAVSAGVFAAHEAGVIHRDLKPPNIFLARGPLDDIVPKVLDFGISKMLDEKMSHTLTGTGTVIGTTPYLSPEQVAGKSVDARSDQYTLGVILYESATGRRPHEGETLFAIMRSIADGRFRRPRELRPDIPAAFEGVIMRAMSGDPERRYESVYALGQALLPFATQRRRLIWSEYYGGERGGRPTVAMPRTEPLPEYPSEQIPITVEPLDDTRTRGRQPRTTPRYGQAPLPTDSFSQSVQLQPKSRAPLVFAALVVLSGIGFGTWWLTRPPPQTVHVEVPPPPPPPIRPIEPEAPPPPKVTPPPPSAANTVEEAPRPTAVVDEPATKAHASHVAKSGKHHGKGGHGEKAGPDDAVPANPTAAPILP